MAKLFIGIALLFMLATATLGFLTKSRIDALQADRSAAKSRVATAEGQAKTAKGEADKAQKEAKDANDKAADAAQQLATKTKDLDDAVKAKDELKLVVDGKDKEIVALNGQIDVLKKGTQPTAVDDPRIAELTAKLQDTQKGLDEAKQLVESQTTHVKDVEAKLTAAEKERQRAAQFGAAGIQGRILAVNGGWNFVVLSVGDKQGVSVNAPLLVVRGNEPVARLRVTSVEPSTSIADVLPGSVRRGVTVQPGDTVIFEGGRAAVAPPGVKTAPEPPAAGPVAAPLP